jgi:two-component system KDP operon response regulator KdpE
VNQEVASKKTVLVVEDDPVYRQSLCRMLSARYKVFFVQESGVIVIEEIAEHHPDLVLLSRLEECETIRDQWPDTAIMVISAESQEKYIVQALDLGADDYIVKPFSLQEVEARIRAVLRRVLEPGRSPI